MFLKEALSVLRTHKKIVVRMKREIIYKFFKYHSEPYMYAKSDWFNKYKHHRVSKLKVGDNKVEVLIVKE